MLPNFHQILDLLKLRGNLYLTDALDVLIIAIILYTLFLFFRKTRSYTVLLGISFIALLYILARYLNLYLTFMVLRYLVGVSLIFLVIIFQNDIRKYFEFIGLIGTRQIKSKRMAAKSPITVELIQASVKMAQAKIGALIILQGRDDLEPYLEGGIQLDGVVSEEILLSIFDDHSDGHDGALIISNNRITKFGAHLPLSNNFTEIGKHGTRHSAGLGISEQTDALAIVVSEEKGKISVCYEGKMKTLVQYADLEKELNRFIKDKYSTQKPMVLTHLIKKNFPLKLAALTSAIAIWFFTAYQAGVVEKVYKVPVELTNIPDNVLIENVNPQEIAVTVSGRGESIFSEIDKNNFSITFDAAKLTTGVNRGVIESKTISTPPNLTVVSYEPDSILFNAQKYYTAKVPVAPKIKGDLKPDSSLESIIVTPESLELLIPEGTSIPIEISTELIDLGNQAESVIIPVELVLPKDIKTASNITTVNVAINIRSK